MRSYFGEGNKDFGRNYNLESLGQNGFGICWVAPQRGFAPRMLGKDEVGGSNPPSSSKTLKASVLRVFVFADRKSPTLSVRSTLSPEILGFVIFIK